MLHLHVKMFIFYTSQMQLVPQGTTVLTAKTNYCKNPLLEAASRLILRKNCSSNPTTNL